MVSAEHTPSSGPGDSPPPQPPQVDRKPEPGLSRRTVAEPEHFEQQEPGRGRTAPWPQRIPWRGWRDIAWRTWREVNQDRLTVIAGSVTYHTLLAIFPALGVFVSVYGLVADVRAVQAQLVQLSAVFPPEAVRLIGEQMLRLATGKPAGLSLAFAGSLLLALWSASAGIRALFDGLNIAYDETEKRNYVLRTALTLGFTAALILFVGVVSAVLVAGPLALEAAGFRTDWLVVVRWPLVFVLAAAAFTVAYRFGPSREFARWRWLVPGGAAAAAIWMAGSVGFSWYLTDVATLDVTYGSLGAVIGFMLWVWFSVMVVLIGAEFNAEIEHQTALDSTTGAPEAMGERGAAMADTVGVKFVGLRQAVDTVRRQIAAVRRRLHR